MKSGGNGFHASPPPSTEIGPAYVQLALGVARWIPGLVQFYQGGGDGRQNGSAEKLSLETLRDQAVALATAVQKSDFERNRRERLLRNGRALLWLIRDQLGETIMFSEQVRLLLDVKAESVDEAFFERAHETLAAALPEGDGSLVERWTKWKQAYTRPAEEALPLLEEAIVNLQQQFEELAPAGAIEVSLRNGDGAVHYEQGVLSLPMETPVRVDRIYHLVAQVYANHLMERAHARRYADGLGEAECAVLLALGPEQILVQGLPDVLLAEADPYVAQMPTLLATATVPVIESERLRAIHAAEAMVQWIQANAALLLHAEGLRPRAVRRRVMHEGLMSRAQAEQAMEALEKARDAAHAFAPLIGGPLLQAWLQQEGNTLAHLLQDPPVPSSMLFEVRFQS